MNMTKIGDRVVCVRSFTDSGSITPIKGKVYTIRDVFIANRYGIDDVAYHLKEIINPKEYLIISANHGKALVEACFTYDHFRPLEEKEEYQELELTAPELVIK